MISQNIDRLPAYRKGRPHFAKSSVRNDDIYYVIGRRQLIRRIVLLIVPGGNKGRKWLCHDGIIFQKEGLYTTLMALSFKKMWRGSASIFPP